MWRYPWWRVVGKMSKLRLETDTSVTWQSQKTGKLDKAIKKTCGCNSYLGWRHQLKALSQHHGDSSWWHYQAFKYSWLLYQPLSALTMSLFLFAFANHFVIFFVCLFSFSFFFFSFSVPISIFKEPVILKNGWRYFQISSNNPYI